MKACEVCQAEIAEGSPRRKVCSDECRKESNRLRASAYYKANRGTAKTCKVCGSEFQGDMRAATCSLECRKINDNNLKRESAERNPEARKAALARYEERKNAGEVNPINLPEKTCECVTCGSSFTAKRAARYCGYKCRPSYTSKLKPAEDRDCIICGATYQGRARTCSQECRTIDRKREKKAYRDRADNQAKAKAYHKQYREDNPERIKELREAWQDANPDKVRKSRRAARIARQNAPKGIPYEDTQVFIDDNWTCCLCHKPVDKSSTVADSPWAPTLEHLTPISRGGADCRTNVALSHRRCNYMKHRRTMDEIGDLNFTGPTDKEIAEFSADSVAA